MIVTKGTYSWSCVTQIYADAAGMLLHINGKFTTRETDSNG